MKTVLITGGYGALGKAVIRKMNELNDFHIFVASRKSRNTKISIPCDIRDESQLVAAIKHSKPDIILHLAASISNDFEESYVINVQPTKHILDFIQLSSLKTRVVVIGSAAEYGTIHPHENPIREDHALRPVSTYGVSKAWQTQLMGLYASQGADVLCARVFNLYGPGISNQLFAGRLESQIKEVLDGKRDVIEVGDLSAIRDYLSTEKAAEQLLKIMSRGETGEVYHIASGAPCIMRHFAHNKLKKHGLDLSILKELQGFSNRKGYDVPVIFADITRTKELYID